MPYVAHKRLVTIIHSPVHHVYYAGAMVPIRVQARVRPSILAAELNRIRDLPRQSTRSYTEEYLNSRNNIVSLAQDLAWSLIFSPLSLSLSFRPKLAWHHNRIRGKIHRHRSWMNRHSHRYRHHHHRHFSSTSVYVGHRERNFIVAIIEIVRLSLITDKFLSNIARERNG